MENKNTVEEVEIYENNKRRASLIKYKVLKYVIFLPIALLVVMLNKRFNIFNIGLLFVLISPIFWFGSWYYIMKISNYKKGMFAIGFIISTILTIVLGFITANYENKKEQEERDLQFKKNEIMQQQKLMNEINALKNNQ